MARPYVFATETTLYHPSEPGGRTFGVGETDPGAAWTDSPGGAPAGEKTNSQALRDLIEADDRINALGETIAANARDLAEMGKERSEALAKVADLEQAAKDAEKAKADAEALAAELTVERDTARAEAARMSDLLKGLEAAKAEAVANAELYAEDNGKLSARIAELEADVAKVDGDKDGKVGGTKPKADKTAEAA